MAKKRDYTRSEYEKLVRKANDILRYADENKITNNTLESVKHALEKVNEQFGKSGRNDRFSSSEKFNKDTNNIVKNLAKTLIEQGNVKAIFGTQTARKLARAGYSKQDILDQLDTVDDTKVYLNYIEELPSDQKYDFYLMSRKLGLKSDQLDKILIESAKKAESEFLAENGYRSINPDKLSRYIRDRLKTMFK